LASLEYITTKEKKEKILMNNLLNLVLPPRRTVKVKIKFKAGVVIIHF